MVSSLAAAGVLGGARSVVADKYNLRLERVRRQMAIELSAMPADAPARPCESPAAVDCAGAPEVTYLPVVSGANVREAESKLRTELKRVGLAMKNVLFAHRYAVASVRGSAGGTAISAIAAESTPAGLAFCEVAADKPEGTLEQQTTEVFGKLRACLAARGMTLASVLTSTVHFDESVSEQQPTAGSLSENCVLRISAVAARF